jgi:D-alanyl-lipoteichoic acid acyltransferase DltB (MBOAT superfamily)
VIYNLLGINTKQKEVVAHGRWLPSLKEFGQVVLTFLLVVFGFIIFRSESISQAGSYFWLMVTRLLSHTESIDGNTGRALLYCGLLIIIEWFRREKVHVLSMKDVEREWIQWAVCFVMIILIYVLMATQVSNFIYFQF